VQTFFVKVILEDDMNMADKVSDIRTDIDKEIGLISQTGQNHSKEQVKLTIIP